MEQPNQTYTYGYITLRESPGHVAISIPQRTDWFALFIYIFWLCLWPIGEWTMVGALADFGSGVTGLMNWLLVVGLAAGWTYGGFHLLRELIWMQTGLLLITLGGGQLVIHRKRYIGAAPAVYDLAAISHFRVCNWVETNDERAPTGTFEFDYGSRTICFAPELSEAEGQAIAAQLRAAGFLTNQPGQ